MFNSEKLIFWILLFCGRLFSQWLEATIYIPDSLSGMVKPQVFAYNATNNKSMLAEKRVIV